MKTKKPSDTKKQKTEKEWEVNDFVEEMDGIMKKQEKENPGIKQVHARLTPEWNSVSEKIGRLLSLADENQVDALREEIVGDGEIATRVLLDLLLTIKNQAKRS